MSKLAPSTQHCVTHGSDAGVFPPQEFSNLSLTSKPAHKQVHNFTLYVNLYTASSEASENLHVSPAILPRRNAYKLFQQCNRKSDQPFDCTALILKFASWQATAHFREGDLRTSKTNKDAVGFNPQQYIHSVWEDLEIWLAVNYHSKFFLNSCSRL